MATRAKGRKLVIVESPAKARTIGRYLGAGYDVAASVGHVRDLPTRELGVDVEHGFEPQYVTIRGKAKVLQELKQKARGADAVILATDPDREGEAIAWHVAEHLGYGKDPDRFRRVEFREITKPAVERALASPGSLDMQKVEAQQARRILDRLVGYQVSPFLWKPIRPGLSAGRVQTVALRLICEREDEIRAFVSQEYWSITAHLEKDEHPFTARLHQVEGKKFTLATGDEATAVVRDIDGLPFRVSELRTRERRKNPAAPFTTSTLQQEAAKRLGFSAKRTMTTAQRLYEGVELGAQGGQGLITYMRTDSTRVSQEAVNAARSWVRREFGEGYLPRSAPDYRGRQAQGAQEAHEAIRPTSVERHPDDVRPFLEPSEARLYELIWLRFVASQMSPALFDTATADFDLVGGSGRQYLFRATGSVLRFPGFTRLYREATEAGDHRRLDDEEPLPALAKGDLSQVKGIEPKQHFTQPPPRFSEASLVKELEALGIGRPSTYAQIISTIVDRGYVELQEKRFHPTPLGDTVSKLLVRVFPELFDVAFTSRMEQELDRVEEGEVGWRRVLGDFYPPFLDRLERGKASSDEIIRTILEAEGESCTVCSRPMLVRWNRFGRFLGCSGYPECQNTRPLDGDRIETGVTELGIDEATGATITLRSGPYGPYLQLGDGERPRRVSLPKGRDPASVDGAYAQKLLALPRTLGTDPASGKPVTAGLGRYGPYVERGGTYRNLRNEEHLFSVQLDEALELLGRQQGRAVLRDMGKHPATGAPLQVLDGRYGPYVTDGAVNASLPKGTSPEELTVEEAVGLLEAQARKGGGGRRGGAKGRGARAAGPKEAASKRASVRSKVPAGSKSKASSSKSAKSKAPTGSKASSSRSPGKGPGGRDGGKG